MWVPRPNGIECHVKPDELARKGGREATFQPIPFCGIPFKAIRTHLKKWLNDK